MSLPKIKYRKNGSLTSNTLTRIADYADNLWADSFDHEPDGEYALTTEKVRELSTILSSLVQDVDKFHEEKHICEFLLEESEERVSTKQAIIDTLQRDRCEEVPVPEVTGSWGDVLEALTDIWAGVAQGV